MTDFFILSVAVLAAVLLVRLLVSNWRRIEDAEQEVEGR